jgi:hypothetical protein
MPHRRVTGSGKKHRSKEKIPLAQEFQYIAFISYSHTDEKAAKSQYARAIHQDKNAIDSIRADFVDLEKP